MGGVALALLLLLGGAGARAQEPNIIVILADDLGYGDLGCYGTDRIRTPRLDAMAAAGARLTDFYAFPTCSPSRAALLTGGYPPRVGIPQVVSPPGPAWTRDRQYGLHPEVVTLPELLRSAGYATGMVGKWHLGHFPQTMPDRHGFDYYYGLPYSNDMLPAGGYPDLPLLRNRDTLGLNPDQRTLTADYTREALDFITRHRDHRFFLYLAHSMPHVPLHAPPPTGPGDARTPYARVVEELDAATGQLLDHLDALDLAANTLVIFTSDNGPWLTYGDHAGAAGPLREGKGTVWEGGTRVPAIAHQPGRIPAGRTLSDACSLLDLLPTLTEAAGSPTAPGDGRSLWGWLTGGVDSLPTRTFAHYAGGRLRAVRRGNWKLVLPHDYPVAEPPGRGGLPGPYGTRATPAALYDLSRDPGERTNRAAAHPGLVARLRAEAAALAGEVERNKRPPFRPGSGD